VPIRFEITELTSGVQIIRLHNGVTKALSRFSGGFDYAVIYLVDSELIFDTGYSWAGRVLKTQVFKILDLQKVKYVLNSHDHEDHTGNNHLFLEHCPNARVFAAQAAITNIRFPIQKPWYRRFLFGPEKACDVTVTPPAFQLSSGRTLEVIPTPGHTDGHICLYDRKNKLLFTGDLFISENLDTQLSDANGPRWVDSLQRILTLEMGYLFDGHGVVVSGLNCKKRLRAKLDFLILLKNKVTEIIARGPITQAELIRELNATSGLVNSLSMGEGWMSFITSGNFSRSNLIRGFVEEASDNTHSK